jgi:hypothetical protein
MKYRAFVALYLELVQQDAPQQCSHVAPMLPAKIQRGPVTLSPEHPTLPRALYGLLSPSRIGPGRFSLRIALDCFRGFWRLCWRFYGWDALHQPGDDPPGFGVGLALGLELPLDVAQSVA